MARGANWAHFRSPARPVYMLLGPKKPMGLSGLGRVEKNTRRNCMPNQSSIAAIALAAALSITSSGARAFDDSKYPDLKGQWTRVGNPNWVQPGGPKAPLTPENQAVYDANRAEMASGGPGDVPSTYCIPQGMPMMMNIYDPMEIIVTPEITYLLISHINDSYRRIYTDGREIPADAELNYAGYSVGKWVDTKGTGRYDELQVETRAFKGPRAYDASGLPLARDNQSIIKERFYLDPNDKNVIYDEITVIDHGLTRPWTILKKASRQPGVHPKWHTEACSEDNTWVRIGKEAYYLSADGDLMPIKKNQAAPDLKYFGQTKK
jgi:hypothetical protein